jgi:hypothetical protein
MHSYPIPAAMAARAVPKRAGPAGRTRKSNQPEPGQTSPENRAPIVVAVFHIYMFSDSPRMYGSMWARPASPGGQLGGVRELGRKTVSGSLKTLRQRPRPPAATAYPRWGHSASSHPREPNVSRHRTLDCCQPFVITTHQQRADVGVADCYVDVAAHQSVRCEGVLEGCELPCLGIEASS